jgi:glucokinase
MPGGGVMHEITTDSVGLVADVGGTYARFGLVSGPGEPHDVRILRCADYPDLVAAIQDYLARISGIGHPAVACVAVAGPVCGDRFRLTNAHWDFSIEQSRRRLGMQRLELINDFAALALAVPQLPSSAFVRIGSGVRWVAEPIALIGPGTGLGVAGLLRGPGTWIPVPGEGGHASLPVETELEAEVIRVLQEQHQVVCAETVLSGPGIARLHSALCTVNGVAAVEFSPQQICESARHGGDPTTQETLAVFCGLLGAFAGNVALTLGARGGVLLGGGVLPKIADILVDSDFRRRFVGARALPGYLDDVATELVVADTPALLGAATRLARPQPVPEIA